MSERKELFMKILVTIVTGIIIGVWRLLIAAFFIFNFFYVLFTGKRHREVAAMSEIWNTQLYYFIRYLIFVSNERPFPFTKLKKSISKFDK